MADEKVTLQLILENQKYIKGLLESKQATKGFTKQALSLGTVLKAAAFSTVALSIYKVGKAALQGAATFEKYKVAFSTMLKSASKADILLNKLKKFGETTPFELDDLVKGSQRLLAFGTSAEDMLRVMTNLGNASSGNAEILDRLTLAYGKIQAKGKASMEELNQVTEAGVPIMDELAKQYGVSTGELYKLVETGKVGFADVDKALHNLTNGTGTFAGMMDKQSKTLGGMFSNILDAGSNSLRMIGDRLTPSFKKLAEAMLEPVSSSNILIIAFNKVIDLIGIYVSVIADMITHTEKLTRSTNDLMGNAQAEARDLIKLQKELVAEQEKKVDSYNDLEQGNTKDAVTANNTLRISRKALAKYEADLARLTGTPTTTTTAPAGGGIKPTPIPLSGIGAGSGKDKIAEDFNKQIALHKYFGQEVLAAQKEVELEAYLLTKENADKKIEITEEAAKKKIQIEKDANAAIADAAIMHGTTILQGAQSIVGQMQELNNMKSQQTIENLDIQRDREVQSVQDSALSEEAKNTQIELINQKFEKQKRAEQRRAAKEGKKLALFDVLLTTPQMAVQAYKAMAGIPIVGPGLGVAAAAAALKFGNDKYNLIKDQPLPQFAVGAYNLPSDMSVSAHRGEMILPANIAAGVRSGELSVGGGQTIININGNLMNGQQVVDYIDRYRNEKATRMGARNYQMGSAY